MDKEQKTENVLKDKIALVTGGSKGIGKAVVARLQKAGATVIVAARNRTDDSYPFIAADLSRREDVEKVAAFVCDSFRRIDILINNMGANTYPGGGFNSFTDEDWND